MNKEKLSKVEKRIVERLKNLDSAVSLRRIVYEGDKKVLPFSYHRAKDNVEELIDLGIVGKREVEYINAKALYYLKGVER